MKIIDKICSYIGNFILPVNIKERVRDKIFCDFESAKTVNILFDARTEKKFADARSFIKYFTDNKKHVKSLGFVEDEKTIDYYQNRDGIDFFCLTNIKLNGKPRNPIVKEFIENNSDILINIGLDNFNILRYIMARSYSKFRVSGNLDDKFADLIIDVKDKKEINFLTKQVKHYLQIIKKS